MPVSPHTHFSTIFSATLFEEIASETNRYVSEKINEAMSLKKHLILVWWEDAKTKELGVILNMARRVKCSVKYFLSEQLLGSSQSYKDIFSRRRLLQLYWDLHVSVPPRAGTLDKRIQLLARKATNVIEYVETILF
jgi:hypothetical protein